MDADIKLVIDQLNNLEVVHDYDENVTDDAAQMLETLGNQIAAQAAVIEKLRGALKFYANPASDTFGNTARLALDTPTDSAQILQEWLDEKLGEPVISVEFDNALNEAGWAFVETCPEKSALLFNTAKPALKIAIEKWLKCSKMFKKPEILK